jgi:HD-GYP domain-containing protein (c-di-GMP phosphodiesterase class II)
MGEAALLTSTLESHDPDEAGHAARVTALALRLAKAIGAADHRLQAIRRGGPLHDIGKLVLDPELLRKPGPLDRGELDEIRTHPERGVELLDGDTTLHEALQCVLFHHERWDGTGYPRGLARDEIPVEARILAIADAYDAMTSQRPYRQALTHAEAIVEIEQGAGTQFDPWLAEAFVALQRRAEI